MVKKLQKKDGLEVLRDDSRVPEPSVGTSPRDYERFGSIRKDLFSRRKSPANCVDWLRKGRGVRCTEDADLGNHRSKCDAKSVCGGGGTKGAAKECAEEGNGKVGLWLGPSFRR